MSAIKAIIYTSTKDTTDNLVFENDDIIAISTNSKVINDIENPEFDIFPNSGTLTVKDKKLVIYNKALNGAFDDFQYKVEYKVDEEVFATHIINERPRYDYENKTCTFYLGNDLDNLDTLQTSVYPYPKEERSLYVIFKDLMDKVFRLTEEDTRNILKAKYFGTININTQKGTYSTYEQYFRSIGIIYPFLPSTNAREALKTILFIAQCGLYKNKNNEFQIVRLDGYTDGEGFKKQSATEQKVYKNVYLIEPQHINKGFVPSVILNNKYDVFNMPYYNAEKNLYSGEEVFKKKYSLSELTTTTIKIDLPFEKNDNYISTPTSGFNDLFWIYGAQKALEITTFDKNIEIEKNQNNNLLEIVEILESLKAEGLNPVVSILTDKKITKYNVDFSVDKNGIYSYDESKLSLKEPTDTIEYPFQPTQNGVLIDSFSYNDISDAWPIPIETEVKELFYNSNIVLNKEIVNYNFKIDLKNYICGTKIERIYGSTTHTWTTVEGDYSGTLELIEIIPKSITIIVKGTVYKIEFNEATKVYKAYNNSQYNYNLQKSLQLLQDTSYISLPSTIQHHNVVNLLPGNLYHAFIGGIHTGELTVIRGDYRQKETVTITNITTNTSTNTVTYTITKNKLFEIGDKVMPCKDYNETPIVTRGKNKEPVIFQVVDVETFAEGGALFQHLKLREIKELT